MANSLLTPTKIARHSLMLLKNQLMMGNKVHRDYIKEMYDPKSGGALTIRKPVQYTVTDGATLSNQDTAEYTTVIPAPSQKHVGMRFSSRELTLTIEEFSKRYINNAVAELANKVDYDGLQLYNKVWNTVGTPGTDPNSYSAVASVAKRLNNLGVPMADRNMCINPNAQYELSDALKGLFSQNLTEDLVRRGELGEIANFSLGMTQNVANHTTGTFSTGSTPVVNGTTAEGATTIVTDGWANSTAVLKAGDVFTIADVYEVNPRNKQSTGVLKQFVAQADVTSDGSGNATITIYDSNDSNSGLRSTGAYQNCNAMPANNATISVWGANGGLGGAGAEGTSYAQNLAFTKNAFALCFFNIETPSSAMGTTVTDEDSGLAVRVIQDYDVTNDREVWRLDVLYSWKCIYPELACRLVGA